MMGSDRTTKFHLCWCWGESGKRDINSVLGDLKVGLRAIWIIFCSYNDDDDADADDVDDADDDDDLSVSRWRL